MHFLVYIAVKIMQTHAGHHGKMPKCLLKASRFVEHYTSFDPICVRVYLCFCACIRIFREDQKDVYQTVNSSYLWVLALRRTFTSLALSVLLGFSICFHNECVSFSLQRSLFLRGFWFNQTHISKQNKNMLSVFGTHQRNNHEQEQQKSI